ncbi:MAG: hypothetical protein HY925_13715 [Elusimicrobia bacterium]|nr:hypothetical protein [Elusimicrobiota bacterium]
MPGGGALAFARSPDEVEGVGAYLSVHSAEIRGREELARAMTETARLYAKDPDFHQETLRQLSLSGTDGWVVDWTRTQSPPAMHQPSEPQRRPVRFRETEVHFAVGGKAYTAAFGAPVELFEKYRPAFEHFLGTLNVSP